MFGKKALNVKLYLGFAAVLVIVAGLGLFAFSRLLIIDEEAKHIKEKSLSGVYMAEEVRKSVLSGLLMLRGHVLSDNREEKEQLEKSIAAQRADADSLLGAYTKSMSEPEDKALFDAIGPLRRKYVDIRDREFYPLSRALKTKEAMALYKARLEPAYNDLLEAVHALVEYNHRTGEAGGEEILASVESAESGLLWGILLTLGIGTAVGIYLSRSISFALSRVIESLSAGSEQVSAASGQVSQSSQQMAEGASQQASSLEETSASLEEMSSLIEESQKNAEDGVVVSGEELSSQARELKEMVDVLVGIVRGERGLSGEVPRLKPRNPVAAIGRSYFPDSP